MELIARKLMKPTLFRTVLLPALLITLLIGTVGCGTPKQKPVAWTIKITKPVSVEVDVVAVTTREKPRLESYSVDKYWSPDDLERKNAIKLTSPLQSATWVIDRKDPTWKKWLGRSVTGVYVIANLPGAFESPDARREYLTLDKGKWNATKQTLEIDVQENRIQIVTPEKE
jgi:hypothetical protein